MKNLWTPWRMEYVPGQNKEASGCPFDADGEQLFGRRHLVLFRDSKTVVMLNSSPYANGHLLVAPARHVGDLPDDFLSLPEPGGPAR